MQFALIAVTLCSLGMAAAMGVVAWRLLRAERRRSAARIDALAELAARDDSEPNRRPAPLPLAPAIAPAESDPLDPPLRRTSSMPAPTGSAKPRTQTNGGGVELFAARDVQDGRRSVVVFAALCVVVAGVVAILLALGQSPARREPLPAGRPAPLELLSLRHAREAETLTISGRVLNPSVGRELRGIVAVAFVFDQAGGLMGSGRAPIAFSQLAPGEESSFQITIANRGGVGRYRIGFRTDDGAVLGHVDRRARWVTTTAEPTSTPARTSVGHGNGMSAMGGALR